MDVNLPAGRWHHRIWVSDGMLDDFQTFWNAVDAYPTTGLWPLLIPLDLRDEPEGPRWFDFTPAPVNRHVDERRAADILAAAWPGACCSPGCLAPIGDHFPVLVRSSQAVGNNRTRGRLIWDAMDVVGTVAVRWGLVQTDRPADIPALLGWDGAAGHLEPADVSAVLRSWEDRFGARLIFLGADHLVVSVPAPPTTAFRAVGVAAEHRAFCPAEFLRRPTTLASFAAELVDASVWSFCWDDPTGHQLDLVAG